MIPNIIKVLERIQNAQDKHSELLNTWAEIIRHPNPYKEKEEIFLLLINQALPSKSYQYTSHQILKNFEEFQQLKTLMLQEHTPETLIKKQKYLKSLEEKINSLPQKPFKTKSPLEAKKLEQLWKGKKATVSLPPKKITGTIQKVTETEITLLTENNQAQNIPHGIPIWIKISP